MIPLEGNFITVILAAGLGKRMNSPLPKVLHPLQGRPLITYVIDLARTLGSLRTLVVVGYRKELVMEAVRDEGVEFVIQEKPLGTADAVKACLPKLGHFPGDLLILSGDVPLLQASTVQQAYRLHRKQKASATVFTFTPPDPCGYGRIVRNSEGSLEAIVEEKDATPELKAIPEVNAGIYFFQAQKLARVLPFITNDNKAGEYYLTDAITLMRRTSEPVEAFFVRDPYEVMGVNTVEQLKELETHLNYKLERAQTERNLGRKEDFLL